MMHQIWNTLLHGSIKSRIFLWSILIMMLLAVFLLVIALTTGSFVYVVGAVSCGMASFLTARSASLRVIKNKTTSKKEKKTKKKHIEKSQKKEKQAHIQFKKTVHSMGELSDDAYHQMDEHEQANARARYLAGMTEKKFKKLMRAAKVRQKHAMVMIDSYQEKKIEQSPAVIWRTDHSLHLLTLMGRAVEFSVPLTKIKGFYYRKNIEANPNEDYPAFQYATFVSKIYAPFLPEYQEKTDNGKMVCYKNLFEIYPGIFFTNTSMKNVRDILENIPLIVDDEIAQSRFFDEYFKEMYQYSILCKNQIISLEDYRRHTEKVLDALLMAPIAGREYAKSLKDMSRYHLISTEYVTKYTQKYWEKKQLNSSQN